MKFKDIVAKSKARKVMILTEKQFQTLASSVVHLMEQEQIKKTHFIKQNSDEK